jgi:mRNA interferase MazF
MPDFNRFDVVAVPFPFTDRPIRQRRPAIVVSATGLTTSTDLLWVMMITAAENRPWAHDIEIKDIGKAGLPIPSVIRPAKIATIESKDVEVLGKVASSIQRQVLRAMRTIMPTSAE